MAVQIRIDDELGRIGAYFRYEGQEYTAEVIFTKGSTAEVIHSRIRQLAVALIKTMVRVGAIKEPGETSEDSNNTGQG